MRGSFIQRIGSRVLGQIRRQCVEVSHGTEVIASAIKVRIGKCTEILSHRRTVIRVIFGRVSILALMLVTELPAKLECGSESAQMIVDPHRCARLQVELRRLPKCEIDRVEGKLGRIKDRISRYVARILGSILAGTRLILAIRPRLGLELCAGISCSSTKARVGNRDLISSECMVEYLISAKSKIFNLKVRAANARLVFRFVSCRQLIGIFLAEISEI